MERLSPGGRGETRYSKHSLRSAWKKYRFFFCKHGLSLIVLWSLTYTTHSPRRHNSTQPQLNMGKYGSMLQMANEEATEARTTAPICGQQRSNWSNILLRKFNVQSNPNLSFPKEPFSNLLHLIASFLSCLMF